MQPRSGQPCRAGAGSQGAQWRGGEKSEPQTPILINLSVMFAVNLLQDNSNSNCFFGSTVVYSSLGEVCEEVVK